ncbi:flagellar basal body-associated FliL family protein [Tropicimonas sp. TH_r6]|uniref:flagellar basal body-associated FliL family protein n=1 Tax=Tropicimonas sp. TH_r6 TaxID=3082085 RepID=UPI0029542642|nr:flagellar basal body-associated FliL family protein [Tropicimonas sp. TH_r6]MDV7141380.1 flagellar basal body-associated FliL family protein [Tropicimonas sp. TH_r6]
MRFVLPLVLALIGAGAGVGAGLYLKPAEESGVHTEETHGENAEQHAEPTESDNAHSDGHTSSSDHGDEDAHDPTSTDSEFTKLNNQFVVPVLTDGKVKSMVVLSLSLETPIGKRELVYSREPRIRDTFLQVLFDHANVGGFDGEFTRGDQMDVLRQELRLAAKQLLGADIYDVLITDIARQDFG